MTVDTDADSGSELVGEIVQHARDETRYIIEEINNGEIIIAELGDRVLGTCPVEYGDECIDPNCDGRIGESERDTEKRAAHEFYCHGCGLNWVDRGDRWAEKYADWPTGFTFEGLDHAE